MSATHPLFTIPLLLGIMLSPLAATAQSAPETTPAAPVTKGAPNDYILNPGDALEISVWKDDALQRQVLVLPDGKISFPLAGFIDTTGISAEKLQTVITERLKKYISDPVVTVAVNSVAGNRIYILGKVTKPGEYQVTRSVDIMQALTLAGGINPFASEDNIKIVRRTPEGNKTIPFEYSEVTKGKNLETNIILKSGDIIIVP